MSWAWTYTPEVCIAHNVTRTGLYHSAYIYQQTKIDKIDRILDLTHLNLQQVAQLSQRDRTAGWVSYGQKWKTGLGRQYLWTL